jgi:hypothetical protein
MKFRIAKLSDLNEIVALHYNVRDTYSVGFFSKMRKSFFIQYYKILLNDPNEIILYAEDDAGRKCGFASSTLDVETQFRNLRKHKIALAIGALPSFILNPKLIFDAWKRYCSTNSNSQQKFVTATGARGEYWVWDKSSNDSVWSTVLYNKSLEVMYLLGSKIVRFEVDCINSRILQFHKRNGAVEESIIILDDGRERILMSIDLNKKFSKVKINRTEK